MDSEKVLIMPIRSADRPSQLRREENPPYPEFAIEMLREFSRAISEQVSPIKEDVGAIKSELQSQGEKLGTVSEMTQSIKGLEATSRKQELKLEDIEGHVRTVKRVVWFIGIVAALIVIAGIALEAYKYGYLR